MEFVAIEAWEGDDFAEPGCGQRKVVASRFGGSRAIGGSSEVFPGCTPRSRCGVIWSMVGGGIFVAPRPGGGLAVAANLGIRGRIDRKDDAGIVPAVFAHSGFSLARSVVGMPAAYQVIAIEERERRREGA